MPPSLTDFLDRLALHHGLGGELGALAAFADTLVPGEASVSLDRGGRQAELRCTLGVRATPHDLEGRATLRAALQALGSGPASAAADEALSRVARDGPSRRYVRALALRATRGRIRPRIGAWVGGDTVVERSRRITDALRALELDAAAERHGNIAAALTSNPFSATVPYGLGLDLARDGTGGAKTYFWCESAEVLLAHIHGPIAHALGLEGDTEVFDSLAAVAGPGWRRTRWLLQASFELPADPSIGPRVKLYVPPARLADSHVGPHGAILQLAAALGLDCTPYQDLVHALGRGADRLRSMVGVSVSDAGSSVEAYVFVVQWDTRPNARVSNRFGPARA